MQETRWKLSRAGLFNFWYYDYEIFDFADGKLLLRGSNGSGKSVTMQSLITVLLDANTQASRLDPFGTTARRMSDYLLGEKEISKQDERTGYLFLEYEKPGLQQYMTTGIGLQAHRSKSNLNFWGFVVEGNVRIGEDFDVCKWQHNQELGKKEPLPLSKRELETELASFGGKVVSQRNEYKALVNKQLFGFNHIDAYDDLIKLLVQLRSPKLSKAFKPSVIYEILHDALAPLSPEELRPLSETIEYINQARAQLAQLKKDREAMLGIRRAYAQYNRFILLEKATGLLQMFLTASEKQEQLEDALALAKQQQKELQALEEQLLNLQREQRNVEVSYDQWKDHDVFKAEAQRNRLTQAVRESERKVKTHQHEIARKQERFQQNQKRIQEEQRRVDQQQLEMTDLLQTLGQHATTTHFDQHDLEANPLEQQPTAEFSFEWWQQQAEAHLERLQKVQHLLRDVARQEERYDDARLQLEQCQIQLETAREQEEQQQQAFERVKEQACEGFEQWLKQHAALLQMEPAEIAATKQALMQLYQTSWSQVLAPTEQAIQRALVTLNQREAFLKQQMAQHESSLRALQDELQTWQNKREPEPPRHRDTEQARAMLKAQGIPCQPLYAVVEFADGLDDAEKERIEAALIKMDLLDALIVPAQHQANLQIKHDRVLVPQSAIDQPSLADVLIPAATAGISTADITAVLQGIRLDGDAALAAEANDTALHRDGRYRIGPLRGHAPSEVAAIYVGKQARETYRLEQIASLQAQIATVEERLANDQREHSFCLASKTQLHETKHSFPAEKPLIEGHRALESAMRDCVAFEKQTAHASQKYREALDQLRALKDECKQAARDLKIVQTLTAYSDAVNTMGIYLRLLDRLQREHQSLQQAIKLGHLLDQQQNELTRDLQHSQAMVREWQEEIAESNLQLQDLALQIQEMNADEICAKLAALSQRKQEIPEQISKANVSKGKLSSSLKYFEASRQQLQSDAEHSQTLYLTWLQVFKSELDLRMLRNFNYHQLPDAVWQERFSADCDPNHPLLTAAKTLLKELANKQDPRDRNSYYKSLNDAFYSHRSDLVEYDPHLIRHEFKDLAIPDFPSSHNWARAALQLREIAERENARLLYNGRRLDLYDAVQASERHIAEQELAIPEQDRKLYQEVILHNIGTVITHRIHETRKWVKLMNQLMRERNISSGIVFSLEWKAKPAQNEGEMDTEDLVTLLTKDRNLHSEQDLDQLIAHFQSRLEEAPILAEESASAFYDEVRQVLDYREWFTFKLFFRKPEKQKRELTDRAFGQFSGGEKAMAMYIPLFSAAYSRFEAAASDAPRMISLDEAFAGVDENNIREMFDLMEQLDFDYIINSQSLWGEYDTVSNLAIVELLRPKDANLVTPVRFRWNGKKLLQEADLETQLALFSGSES